MAYTTTQISNCNPNNASCPNGIESERIQAKDPDSLTQSEYALVTVGRASHLKDKYFMSASQRMRGNNFKTNWREGETAYNAFFFLDNKIGSFLAGGRDIIATPVRAYQFSRGLYLAKTGQATLAEALPEWSDPQAQLGAAKESWMLPDLWRKDPLSAVDSFGNFAFRSAGAVATGRGVGSVIGSLQISAKVSSLVNSMGKVGQLSTRRPPLVVGVATGPGGIRVRMPVPVEDSVRLPGMRQFEPGSLGTRIGDIPSTSGAGNVGAVVRPLITVGEADAVVATPPGGLVSAMSMSGGWGGGGYRAEGEFRPATRADRAAHKAKTKAEAEAEARAAAARSVRGVGDEGFKSARIGKKARSVRDSAEGRAYNGEMERLAGGDYSGLTGPEFRLFYTVARLFKRYGSAPGFEETVGASIRGFKTQLVRAVAHGKVPGHLKASAEKLVGAIDKAFAGLKR